MVNATALMLTRREQLAALGALALFAPSALRAGSEGTPFSTDLLVNRAAELARSPWRDPAVHDDARAIDYDALNRITYRADRGALDGRVRFFPLSRSAHVPVRINLVAQGRAAPFRFSADLFDTGDRALRRLLDRMEGFAGFRAMNPNGVGDWLAFQGASYFRAAGALDQYGLSARGIAIDTSVPGNSEEFPRFSEFWLERGSDGALIVYALLDGPSVTGAYRFVNRHLKSGVVQQVSATLFARRDIAQLGVAPLTSMFWYGEGDRSRAIDWRPEIHDSDGLAILTGAGERIWRPLGNPPRVTTSSFLDHAPRAFGLLQRDRNFDHYQDDGVFYEKRPSLWVEPEGDWGPGAVTLYEIPTSREIDDNIVAFWTPARPFRAGEKREYRYTLSWIADEPAPAPAARTVSLWQGIAGRPGHDPIAGARKVVADFEGPSLAGLARGAAQPMVSVNDGRILAAHAYPVQGMPGRWRLAVDIERAGAESSVLRGWLKADGAALTETLVHQLHWTD